MFLFGRRRRDLSGALPLHPRACLRGAGHESVCGLGNPGRQSRDTGTTPGSWRWTPSPPGSKVAFTAHKFEAELAQLDIGGLRLLLLKPQTFMNLSGTSLAGAARFYKVAPSDVLVVHDELDLPFGRLQLKEGGGTGGRDRPQLNSRCLGRGRLRAAAVRHWAASGLWRA